MTYQPLIRFRHAIRKAAEAGKAQKPSSSSASSSTTRSSEGKAAADADDATSVPSGGLSMMSASSSAPKISDPSNRPPPRPSIRLQKPVPRAKLSSAEMEAIMLGGAL